MYDQIQHFGMNMNKDPCPNLIGSSAKTCVFFRIIGIGLV